MEDWIYRGVPFTEPKKEDIGFVYIITNKNTGRKYIGQKVFWNSRYLPKTKKRKRRKKVLSESSWKEYFGSCSELLQEAENIGYDCYTREILHICEKKSEMNYIEAKEQFDREVLLKDEYYNGIIQCRINKKHLGSMKIES